MCVYLCFTHKKSRTFSCLTSQLHLFEEDAAPDENARVRAPVYQVNFGSTVEFVTFFPIRLFYIVKVRFLRMRKGLLDHFLAQFPINPSFHMREHLLGFLLGVVFFLLVSDWLIAL